MSSREYAEWLAFTRHEPIGDQRRDLQTAGLMALIVNVNRIKGQKAKVQDFMPVFWPGQDAVPDWHRHLTMIEMINAAFGGDDLREAE